MGFIRVALVEPEHRKQTQREIADQMREILNDNFPASSSCSGRAAWSPACSRTATSRRWSSRSRPTTWKSSTRRRRPSPRSRAPCRASATSTRRCSSTTRSCASRPTARGAALVDVTARGAAQTTLEATLGNINTPSVWIDAANGQSYYVVTSYDGRVVDDPNALARIPVRIGANGGAVTLGAYSQIRRSLGPIAIERNHLSRVAHVAHADRGARPRQRRARARREAARRSAHARHPRSSSSARST